METACQDNPEEVWYIDFDSLQREINERRLSMPLIISSNVQQKFCSISNSGIGIPDPTVKKVGWKQERDRIEIGYIPDSKCILFSKPIQSLDSFLVAYANKNTQTGVHISCQAFIRNQIRLVISLPKKDIIPILFPHDKWCMAFILGEFPQQLETFSEEDAGLLKKILIARNST